MKDNIRVCPNSPSVQCSALRAPHGRANADARQAQRRRRDRRRGFSLVEIMIAVTIITLIMGSAAVVGLNSLKKARVSQTRNIMHEIEGAVTQFAVDTGDSCPPSLTTLVEKKILKKEPKDGFGEPFTFKCPGEHNSEIDLISKGPDKKEGTEDDIRSWEEEKK